MRTAPPLSFEGLATVNLPALDTGVAAHWVAEGAHEEADREVIAWTTTPALKSTGRSMPQCQRAVPRLTG